ncbi:MAG: GGDEF domain-containing protein [Oscillospiraceae bacterium]|nr:GGDEF domain-containing protein [Oscillospiraceae bacterium]
MSSIICSENFRRFFESVDTAGLTLEELSKVISSQIAAVAADIRLGSMACKLDIPPSPYNPSRSMMDIELYRSASGAGEASVATEFLSGENGGASIISYPEKGYVWDDEETQEIGFLHNSIALLYDRANLHKIVRTSLSVDALTKLPNATGFIAIGKRLFKQGTLHEYTAMYLNIKNFRSVNTQVGRKHSDKAIVAFARTLRSKLCEDEFVARLGGDNFTVLVKKENSSALLDFLSHALIELELESTSIHFVLSSRVGVYNIAQGDDIDHVMLCISTAINNVRRSNMTDVVFFTTEILDRMEREQNLTALFSGALENREFVAYYQPKVELTSSSLCGCEALVRWRRGDKLVSPAEFIPVFERDGNICALDFYMLDRVCHDIKQWIEQGLQPVTVSVNFSKTHLHDPDIADKIISIINNYGIDHRYIEIEMTEMSDFSDYQAFKAFVTKLKENDVITSIDDFGTGYSSLNLLTDFMFDVVKLDKSFLDNISRSASKTDEIVVRNIVKMIKELGMKTIAEGVETVEQAHLLKDIGCFMVQGYLYDKPLCVDDFVERLRAKSYSIKVE